MQHNLTSEQLQILPELAILVALDAILQTTIRALHAAHPELIDDESNPKIPDPISAPACAADVIVNLSGVLLDALERYERVNYHLTNIRSSSPCIDDPF